jgi:hypothetical protein
VLSRSPFELVDALGPALEESADAPERALTDIGYRPLAIREALPMPVEEFSARSNQSDLSRL